jgi:hypothetical protein
MDDVNETAQRIKTRLTNLDDVIKQKAASDSDANARIKRTLHSSAQKKVLHIFATNNCAFRFQKQKVFFLNSRSVYGLHDALSKCSNEVSSRCTLVSPSKRIIRYCFVVCAFQSQLHSQLKVDTRSCTGSGSSGSTRP